MIGRLDPDEYVKGEWKSAVEAQCSHYARLGLNPQDHVTAGQVRAAHAARAAWWTQLSKQAEGGRNNPRVAEMGPHIKAAIKNLQEAADVLCDVDRKVAYDRQLQAASANEVEEKFRSFILFTLRDKVLTVIEKNDLLDQASELGITRERAEALIQEELTRTASSEEVGQSPVISTGSAGRSQETGSDRPNLAVDQKSLSFGTLRKGEKRESKIVIDNKGGGTLSGSIHSSDPDWLIVSPSEIDTRRHHQELLIRIDTHDLNLGKTYVGAVEVISNGGRESIRIDLTIELEAAAVKRFRKQMFWLGALFGAVFGMCLYAFVQPPFTASITELAGIFGAISLVVVCAFVGKWGGGIGGFILASMLQTIFKYASARGYSMLAWAEIIAALLFFWARPLLVHRLAGDRRVAVWTLLSGVTAASVIIIAGFAIGDVSATRGTSGRGTSTLQNTMMEDFNGSSKGEVHGITYAASLGGRGAMFSREAASRIEYRSGIPQEGTLEWWIWIDDAYRYDNFVLHANENCALVFATDAQGGDVTWPGATKFIACKDGQLVLDMAQAKYNDRPHQQLRVASSKFRFGEWHSLGISFGSEGQAIALDGKALARNPSNRQILGAAGTHQGPADVPTIGESVSSFWRLRQYSGGFQGVVYKFRASPKQHDWVLSAQLPEVTQAIPAAEIPQANTPSSESTNAETNSTASNGADSAPATRAAAASGLGSDSNAAQAKQLNTQGLKLLSATQPNLQAAMHAFEQAVNLDSTNIEALNNLGYVYGRMGDYSNAEAILRRVLQLSPSRRAACGNLGYVEAKLGKTQEAAAQFCQYVRLFDSLQEGKATLVRVMNDSDQNVQSAVESTVKNCSGDGVQPPPTGFARPGSGPVAIPESVMRPLLIEGEAPAYPPLAKQAGISGTVVLRADISATGNVEDVRVLSGHPMLATAATAAVRRWRYKPYTQNGQPVPVQTQITVPFVQQVQSIRR